MADGKGMKYEQQNELPARTNFFTKIRGKRWLRVKFVF